MDETAALPEAERLPAHLFVSRFEYDEWSVFIWHEKVGWWERVGDRRDEEAASNLAYSEVAKGHRAAVLKHSVAEYPYSTVFIAEGVDRRVGQ